MRMNRSWRCRNRCWYVLQGNELIEYELGFEIDVTLGCGESTSTTSTINNDGVEIWPKCTAQWFAIVLYFHIAHSVRNNSTKPAGAPSSVVSSTIPPQVNEVYVYSRAKLPTDAKGAVCNMHKLLICLQEIVLASMNSPFDIHVRLASKYAEYVAMMQSLQQYYSKEKKLSTRLFDVCH